MTSSKSSRGSNSTPSGPSVRPAGGDPPHLEAPAPGQDQPAGETALLAGLATKRGVRILTGSGTRRGDCERYGRLLQAVDDGHLPTERESRWLQEHPRRCDTCRLERAAREALRYDGGSGPAPQMDDLASRRMVNEVVDRALAPGAAAAARGRRSGGIAPPRRRRALAIAVAGAALVTAAGVGYLALFGGDRRSDRRGARRPEVATARVVLGDGRLEVDGRVRAAGEALALGSRLKVTGGRAALSLPGKAMVLLERGARLRLLRVEEGEMRLFLEEGSVLAAVQPRRGGSRFRVATPLGEVQVLGTVFAVRVNPGHLEVRVLRGAVRVVPDERAKASPKVSTAGIQVERGNKAVLTLGGMERHPLTAAEERKDMIRRDLLSLLGTREPALLQVRSRPSGAKVRLGSLSVGRTPLTAQVQPGHLRLSVTLDDRTPVTEQISVRPGERVQRDYELAPLAAGAVAGVSAAVLGAARRSPVGSGEGPKELDPRDVAPAPRAGGSVRRSGAAPAARDRPRSTAAALLDVARRHRAAKSWRRAARAYRELLSRHGQRPEAASARVALGQLLLDHLGDPRGALRQFEVYLGAARRGSLAQEAAFGRIRALRRLGRLGAERKAIEQFLHYYPGALQEPLVKRRLEALSRGTSRSQGKHPGSTSGKEGNPR